MLPEPSCVGGAERKALIVEAPTSEEKYHQEKTTRCGLFKAEALSAFRSAGCGGF